MSPEVEDRSAGHGRRAGSRPRAVGRRRGGLRSLAALVALVGVTAGLTACGPKPKGSFPEDDPRSAVNQLLRATIGQANGQRACALLTEEARERFDRTIAGSCRSALNTAIAALPGSASSGEGTGRAAEDLEFESRVDGDRATVTAFRGDGPKLTFEVVRLNGAELAADEEARGDRGVGSAPKSDWRVDRGVEQLVEVPEEPTGSDADAGAQQ